MEIDVNILLSDVRQVTLDYIGGSPATYLMLVSEVDRFVESSKRLHFKPGRNPHNNGETAKVWKITVAEMEFTGPFWWTVPDLQKNDDPAGARLIQSSCIKSKTVFVDEEAVARWHAEEAEAEAEHYRTQEKRARADAVS